MRTSKFLFWMILPVMVMMVASCGDKEDVYDSDDYFYYLDIKSEVRLYLNDAADVYLVNLARNLVCDAKVKNIEQHPTDYYFITTDMTIE